MRELTEDDLWRLAEEELGDTGGDWPVLFKEEEDASESAVCVKRTQGGFILGVSCDRDDLFHAFFSTDREAIDELCERFVTEMKQNGSPLSGAVKVRLQP